MRGVLDMLKGEQVYISGDPLDDSGPISTSLICVIGPGAWMSGFNWVSCVSSTHPGLS